MNYKIKMQELISFPLRKSMMLILLKRRTAEISLIFKYSKMIKMLIERLKKKKSFK